MIASHCAETASRPRTQTRVFVTTAIFACLVCIGVVNYVPPLAPTQNFTVTFTELRPGARDPLIVAGERENSDFLYVKCVTEESVAFGYDRWGAGGPVSAPIPVRKGHAYPVTIEFPSFVNVSGNFIPPEHSVKVWIDGREVFACRMQSPLRAPKDLWIGRNPLGGSTCGPGFHGQITDPAGRDVLGNVAARFSVFERLKSWSQHCWIETILLFLLAVGCTAVAGRIGSTFSNSAARNIATVARRHAPAIITIALATGCFTWLITGGSGQLFYHDGFGDFYDHQAVSLVRGRLDVPPDAIGIEAFVSRGRYYGYFGLTPALLRIPAVLLGVGFGELTRPSMLLAYVACLTGAYLILLEARRISASAGSVLGAVLFIANVAVGSTILFLGSRAYVYHEAILWGVGFAVWSILYSLRLLREPAGRWWIGALLCGVLSVHARPPTGLAALGMLGVVALAGALAHRGERRRCLAIAVLAALGVLSFNAISYAKFKTLEGCPLRLNVQYNAARLARIDGKEFHVSNIPFATYTYFVAPNLLIERRFPWVFLNVSKPDAEFPGAKVDYADKTLALPYAMTGLCLLAAAGIGLAMRHRPVLRTVAVTWISVGPMIAAMLMAVALAHRYTADFCPFLVVAAAFGVVAFDAGVRRVKLAFGTILVVATAWSIFLNAAITLHYQGAVIWGTPDETRARYQTWQHRIDAWTHRGDET